MDALGWMNWLVSQLIEIQVYLHTLDFKIRGCQLWKELRLLVAVISSFLPLLFISLISSSGLRKAQEMPSGESISLNVRLTFFPQQGGWRESWEEATRGCEPKEREKPGAWKSQATQGKGTGLPGRGSSCWSASTTSSTLAPPWLWSLETWRCYRERQSCPLLREIGGWKTWSVLAARTAGSLHQKEAPGNTEVDEEEGGSWVPRLIRSPPKAEHIPLNALIFGGNTNTHTRW